MEENKDSGSCCGPKKCCCVKKLIYLLMALAIFALGYFFGKANYCPFSGGRVCPMLQK